MPTPQRVLITYSGPLTFLQSDQWKQVHAALSAQLPLRNLHWKSASHPTVRTIQTLSVDLVPLDIVKDESTSQVPQSVLSKPLLNVYVFVCEDADVYKSTVRKQIKEWHSLVSERKQQEYLIVHIARPETRVASGGIFRVQSSVLDKVRADFNSDKRERCVQLAWAHGVDSPAAWADLVNKLKDGVLTAFDMAVGQREEEIRRSESQRTMPGWNFCTFFVLKESLALSFVGVGLHEEALTQYDALESSFFAVLQEKSLSWFGSLTPDPVSLASEATLPLLSVEKKAYRDLILANTISVFDFRVYLLARQCNILGSMGRVVYVAKKVTTFLGAFGRRLKDVADQLPPCFVETWSYASALSVVEQCDIWAAEADLESSAVAGFNSAKAELLEHARKQLDILGVQLGHLPARLPFPTGIKVQEQNPDADAAALVQSLKDAPAFYDLYVAITNRAIDLYAKAGRKKFALRLHGDLAALDMYRGRIEQAVQTYTSLPAHYSHYKWIALEAFMHDMTLDIRAGSGQPKGKEWINAALSLLRLYTDTGNEQIAASAVDKARKVGQIVEEFTEAAKSLEDDLTISDHPMLRLNVEDGQASLLEDDDGSELRVSIRNILPCAICLTEVVVAAVGRNDEKLTFTGRDHMAEPGLTSVNLKCSTTASGTFILTSITLRVSQVIVQYIHRKSIQAKPKPGAEPLVLIRIPKDLRAVDVQLHQPRRIELGASSNILLSLYTGRSDIRKAVLRLKGPGSIAFRHSKAAVQTDDVNVTCDDDAVTFVDIGKERTVSILVPHSNASSFQSIDVGITIEYTVPHETNTTRSIVLSREVVTSLPLQVNVQDFFRGQTLFSRFTISTTSQQYIRVDSAELGIDSSQANSAAAEGVEVKSTGSRVPTGIIVTPAHPTNFLFKITSEQGPVRDSLQLRVRYRTLLEEASHLVRAARHNLPDVNKDSVTFEDATTSLVSSLEANSVWLEPYRMSGRLRVPTSGPLDDLKSTMFDQSGLKDVPWRELLLPVDIPQMSILSAVRVRLHSSTTASKQSLLYAGQPLAAEVIIQTSFHWGLGHGQQGRTFRMRFDIEEMVREWLVSGQKRGDFMAKDGGTFVVPITLIALNHGELALPKVSVSPLPMDGEMTMGSMALPSSETHQLHGAEKMLILPRGGRTTFVVGMGGSY